LTTRLPKVKTKEYLQLDGRQKVLVERVGDGSIIKRFDKTRTPRKGTDVVCPHFLEFKWAYGCPFDCAWCFLKGTLRLLRTKTDPIVKDYLKIQRHLQSFFENDGQSQEILNTGELADSLMSENSKKPFTKLLFTPTRKRSPVKRGPRVFGHAGGGPGVGAIFEIYLDLDYIDVIFSNYDPDSMWTVSKEIKRKIISK